MECDQIRDLAPELALGIADGAERASALRHVANCPDCRRVLDELSTVSDELLLLAPVLGLGPATPVGTAHRQHPSPN